MDTKATNSGQGFSFKMSVCVILLFFNMVQTYARTAQTCNNKLTKAYFL